MNSEITLTAFNGKFLCCEGEKIVSNRGKVGPWEVFSFIWLSGKRFALRAYTGKYVCAEGGGGGEVNVNRDRIGEWEQFTLVQHGDRVSFRTHNGHYLCADFNLGLDGLIVADRDVSGPYEWFEIDVVQANSVPVSSIDPGSSKAIDYNINLLTIPIKTNKPFTRATATKDFMYVGEYADRRSDGGEAYLAHDRVARLWRGRENSLRQVARVANVESIHAMAVNPAGDGINFGTEQNCKVYSFHDLLGKNIQYIFNSTKGLCLGAGDCGRYGELVAMSAFNGDARIAGYRKGNSKIEWSEIHYRVPNKFVWALTEFNGVLLAGCSYNNHDWNHPFSGSIVRIYPDMRTIYDPPYGFCKGFFKKDGILYCMFGGKLVWTKDLRDFHSIDMPGYACWSMIDTGPDTMVGVWYTEKRIYDRNYGKYPEGVWLVEFNIKTGKVRTLMQWGAPGKTAPYYTGGGLVKLKGKGIGFITIEGISRILTIEW